MDLSKQYNEIAEHFITLRKTMNQMSDEAFLSYIFPLMKNPGKAIDFGCGPGDLIVYISNHIECVGVDSSSEMVSTARNITGKDVREEDFANTSFEDESFSLVFSKWAMQTSKHIDPIYKEAARLLKPSGHFVFLVVHPFRQFLEKKKFGKDYFKQEIVQSVIFNRAITVEEPTHTISDYLSDLFFQKFNLIGIKEGAEFPAAEQIGGDIYPTYLIVTAQKK